MGPLAIQPLWKRLLWPSWPQRKRILRVEAWIVVLGSYALLALAYLWPQDYRNESPAFVVVAWLAFLVRVLQFHLGLMLAAIALIAAFVRGRRLLLAAVPLLLLVNRDTQPIVDEIRAAGADVVLLQEYTNHWHAAMKAALAERYPFSSFVTQDDSFGVAV